MNFLIWNIRGLNHPSKHLEVKNMIRVHKIDLICLLETRVKIHNADKVRSCIVPNWDYVYNYDQHTLGRIWICWKHFDFEVTVLRVLTVWLSLLSITFAGITLLFMVTIREWIGSCCGIL
jgi:hypothetical protein